MTHPMQVVIVYFAPYMTNGEKEKADRCELLIKEKFPNLSVKVFNHDDNFEAFSDILQETNIIFTFSKFVINLLPYTPKLQWVQLTSAGYDQLQKYFLESGYIPKFRVTRMGDTYGPIMAEYVIAQIVGRERNFQGMRKSQEEGKWNSSMFGNFRHLNELTIGIVGAGNIGKEVAKYCKSFYMKTVGLVRQIPTDEKRSEFIDVYRTVSELPLLVAESDYICSILPGSPETVNFFRGDIFSHSTKKPVFMNIGRGNCIEEDTIINSLRQGWLSGAILDVTSPEPLPKESKLWKIPEVVITPHVSGIASVEMMMKTFLKNIEKFMKGEKLDNEIGFSKL